MGFWRLRWEVMMMVLRVRKVRCLLFGLRLLRFKQRHCSSSHCTGCGGGGQAAMCTCQVMSG
jgi:hypothetical protein